MFRKLRSLWAIRRSQKLNQRGLHDRAIALLAKEVMRDRDNPFLHLHLGCSHAFCDFLEKARESVLRAMQIAPSSAVYPLFLGRILLDAEQYQEAAEQLQASIGLDSNNQLAWGYLALAHLGMGDISQFRSIIDEKGISENSELQIRMIILLERVTRMRKRTTDEFSHDESSL